MCVNIKPIESAELNWLASPPLLFLYLFKKKLSPCHIRKIFEIIPLKSESLKGYEFNQNLISVYRVSLC